MAKHKAWFFKSEFENDLVDLGAIKVTQKDRKKTRRRVQHLSGMTFTRYGKGYILTTDETDSRYGSKYILSDISDGGFWNSNANGWFFKKSHFDILRDYGAQYI